MDLDAEYADYKIYIDEFAKTIDPDDQLPLRTPGYSLREYEIHGEVTDWILNYLGRGCPITLRIHLVNTALKKVLEKVHDAPSECGYDPNRDSFNSLKLVRVVVSVINNLIFDLQCNAKLYEVPLPPSSKHATELTRLKQPPKISIDAIKNSRRTMEDRHVVSDDFNGYFNTQDTEPTFYYGIFDGHSGSDAASYANSHLNYNIAVHPKYPSDIKTAMTEAFLVTDIEFLKKANVENLNSGTTALCAIYRKTQKKLFVGWCGDSQALIARVGNIHQIVRKHSPEDLNERKRIEQLGGVVLFWGNSYRVNGQLAVSRAIGDMNHKPYVSAEPEIVEFNLDGEEDFLVLGCDGLWDSMTEEDVALTVYKNLRDNPSNYNRIASDLCALAKDQGSRDNITVIIVYLKEPELIASQPWTSEIASQNIRDNMDNLNMYESEQVAPQQQQPQPIVSMDALGNTNQDIFNNPFGDYNNQLISDVASATLGKSTEITDMVLQQQQQQQQPEIEFCNNLTDTLTNNLNSINNNKINNGSHEAEYDEVEDINMEQNVDFMAVDQSPEQPQEQASPQQVPDIENDDNNNRDSANNFGPETDVDAILDENEEIHMNHEARGVGEKERTQMEFKEMADDVIDHAEQHMSFQQQEQQPLENAMFGTLENKVFGEMFPEMKMGIDNINTNNPFEITNQMMDNFVDNMPLDNKMIEEQIDEMHQQQHDLQQQFEYGANDFIEKVENVEREIDLTLHEHENAASGVVESAAGFMEELISSANNEEVAIHQQQEPQQSDLELIGTQSSAVAIGGGESGAEESEEEDEWNYIKVEEKEKSIVTEVSGAFDKLIEEEKQEFEIENIEKEPPTAPIESIANEFEFNTFTGTDNQQVEQGQGEEEEELKETDNTDEMESQLNPEAKEFVPVSPVSGRVIDLQTTPPYENGKESPLISHIRSNIIDGDNVISQSPRKGDNLQAMDDVQVPENENEFELEAKFRPHGLNIMDENFQRTDSPSAKEAMQVDDKLEQDYLDDTQLQQKQQQQQQEEDKTFFEEEKVQESEEYKVLESSFDQYSNNFQSKIDDAMNRSFYEGRDGNIMENASDVLNTVQRIPSTFEDDQPEADHQFNNHHFDNNFESDEPEADLLVGGNGEMIESSDNFEAEKFVEEIKGVSENKYVDMELSPTIPEVAPATTFQERSEIIQPLVIEETIVTHNSLKEKMIPTNVDSFAVETLKVDNLEAPKEDLLAGFDTETVVNDLKDIKEEQFTKCFYAPAPQEDEKKKVVEAPKNEPKTEVAKKKVTSTTSTVAKKPSPATKAPVKPASEVKPKTTSTVSSVKAASKTTTASKPSAPLSAPVASSRSKPLIPPATKKPSSTSTVTKTSTVTARTITKTETKPVSSKPASTSTTVPSKRPVTSAFTARPAPKTTSVTNGTTPKASSAPAARAPAKATTLTVKSKVNGTSSATSTATKSPLRPTTTTARPTASSPLKEKVLNKSSVTTTTKSPRPVTSASSVKSTLKSPSTATTKTLSAVGTKKPITSTITKKAPGTTTTSTVVKKSPSATSKAVSSVTSKTAGGLKKTSTTTTVVTKKKVVNGDIVAESTETTTKTSNDLNGSGDGEMNGHVNGNGLMENGSSEQGIIETTGI